MVNKEQEKFYEWFVGFSDAEAMFGIFPTFNNKNQIESFSFRFIIGLHIDDLNTLNYIQNKLGIGYVYEYKDTQTFIVTKKEDINKLISIFDKYSLNSSKYLDYMDFKKAFTLYFAREGLLTDSLRDEILKFKDNMNTKRIDFSMPINHVVITKS